MTKHERIQKRVAELGAKRKERKREKHSDNFNRMFSFFVDIVRKDICSFCGSDVERDFTIIFDPNAVSAKMAFKYYENGELEDFTITTRHPNIVITAIRGKKGWGLNAELFAQGISDETFTKYEILEQFDKLKIKIPDSYLKEFENLIWKKRLSRNNSDIENYLNFKIDLFLQGKQI